LAIVAFYTFYLALGLFLIGSTSFGQKIVSDLHYRIERSSSSIYTQRQDLFILQDLILHKDGLPRLYEISSSSYYVPSDCSLEKVPNIMRNDVIQFVEGNTYKFEKGNNIYFYTSASAPASGNVNAELSELPKLSKCISSMVDSILVKEASKLNGVYASDKLVVLKDKSFIDSISGLLYRASITVDGVKTNTQTAVLFGVSGHYSALHFVIKLGSPLNSQDIGVLATKLTSKLSEIPKT